MEVLNSNPVVLDLSELPRRASTGSSSGDLKELHRFSLTEDEPRFEDLESDEDPVDDQEVFDLLSQLQDPEHPLTLGQLNVVGLDRVRVEDNGKNSISHVYVEITPTVTHCSLATLIGLGIKVRLNRALSPRFRAYLSVTPGSHQSEQQVNKQLNDKERVAAASENPQLLRVVEEMLVRF